MDLPENAANPSEMDDIYTFGQTPYIPADPLDPTIARFVQNICILLITGVKCTIIGGFILLKSIVFLFVPVPSKSIQNKVALVQLSYLTLDLEQNE